MTDHPLSETAAAELWEVHIPERKTEYLGWQSFPEPSRRCFTAILRAAFDAGREGALQHLTADDLPTRLIRDIQGRTIRAAARAATYEEDGIPWDHDWDRATVAGWLEELADNIEETP